MALDPEQPDTPAPIPQSAAAAKPAAKPVSSANRQPQDGSSSQPAETSPPPQNAGQNNQAGDVAAMYALPDAVLSGNAALAQQKNKARGFDPKSKQSRSHLKFFHLFGHVGNAIKTAFTDGENGEPEAQSAHAPVVADAPHAPDYSAINPPITIPVAAVAAAPLASGDDLAYLNMHRTANTDLAHLDQARFVPALAGLGKALQQRGFDVQFISMYRSPEKQLQTIHDYTVVDPVTGRSHLTHMVAGEYDSYHVVGCATDTECAGAQKFPPGYLAALKELAPQFGLRTIDGDPGHVQLNDTAYVNQLRQEKFGFNNLVYHKQRTSAVPVHSALET